MSAVPGESRGSPLVPYALLALAALAWGGNFVVGRFVRDDVPPVALDLGRWLIAFLVLVPFTWRGLVAKRAVLARHWRLLATLGIIGPALFNTMQYVALVHTEAINAGLIMTMMPVVIFALSFAIFRERMSVVQGLGVAVSLAGTVVLLTRGDVETLSALRFNRGDLWMIAAVPLWALYSVLIKLLPREINLFEMVCVTTLAALVLLLPLWAWELSTGAVAKANVTSVAGVFYVGLVASVLAYLCWNRGVMLIGANRAGVFIHLIPVFSAVLAIAFLGEALRAYHVAGAGIIFAGIWLTNRR